MAMDQMPPEGQPQEGQPQQGADVMKQLGAALMQSVQQDGQAGQLVAQMGNKQAADLLMQAAQLKQQALDVLGMQGGGQPQEAGAPNAQGEGVAPVGPAV